MGTILVVDDEELIRRVIVKLLERHGYTVVAVGQAKAALERVAAGGVALVLTDVLMPDMDGTELLLALRRRYSEVPVIAMSGGGRISAVSYLDTMGALGAAAVLPKPFTEDELVAVIERHLPGG